jgi:hypothetical protein
MPDPGGLLFRAARCSAEPAPATRAIARLHAT